MNFSRKSFIKSCIASGFISSCPALAFSHSGIIDPELTGLINRIGNANNDKERVLLLEQVLRLESNVEEKEIIRQILNVADRWANSFEKYAKPGTEGNENEGFLCGFIRCSLDRSILPIIPEDHKFSSLLWNKENIVEYTHISNFV